MTPTPTPLQSVGGMTASHALGCNVSGDNVTIQDNRIIIILQGIDDLEAFLAVSIRREMPAGGSSLNRP